MLINTKVLLVEDSDSDRFLFSRYLQQLGYECDCFENGKQFIDRIADYPSSLVLLDIELPVMNGLETALQVRKHHNETDRRFILIGLTSHNDPEVLDKIAASGFDNCLHKPIRKKELELKLKQYISSSMDQNSNFPNSTPDKSRGNRIYSLEMFEADDPEFIESIVSMFVASTPSSISQMKEAFEKRDWENLRMLAHKLKPHLNYFMISDGAQCLKEIEEFARSASGEDKIPDLMLFVEQKCNLVFSQMKEDFPSIGEN